jgi:hypothetical protein
VIEAIQYVRENAWDDIMKFVGQTEISHETSPLYFVGYALFVTTLEGDMRVSVGDYIIKGIAGEFYPCKEIIFDASYELEDE